MTTGHDEWKERVAKERLESVPKAIAKLRTEAAERASEADRLDRLYRQYPDLVRTVGRWDKVAFSSKSANSQCDRFDLRHNCGCCSDSPLEIWPYKETEIGKVYSDPSKFIVGEKNYLGGDSPSPNWETPLREAGISETIIGSIRMHFKRCRDDLIESANDLYEGAPGEPEPLL